MSAIEPGIAVSGVTRTPDGYRVAAVFLMPM